MKNQITIREAITEADIAAFWEQLHTYHMRDIFPDPENENRKHFLDDSEYRAQIQHVHDRPQDRCYYLFFHRDGQDIGFALPAILTSEDGKCFILEFCIFPAFRGGGTGRSCADALLSWAKMRGARYAELNYGGDERRLRFWKRVGFVENGADEWGEPLMLLPPADPVPFTVEVLEDPDDWQLRKLENGFKREIGEDATNTIDENSLMLIGEADALLAEANTDQVQPQVPALAQDTTVLRTTDKLPEFPGGITEFMKWLTKNLRYPEQARSNKIQGKVVVSFIVNKDGSISSPTVQKSVDPLLDREALRVIRMMPHWKPGIMDSKPCRTMFATLTGGIVISEERGFTLENATPDMLGKAEKITVRLFLKICVKYHTLHILKLETYFSQYVYFIYILLFTMFNIIYASITVQ